MKPPPPSQPLSLVRYDVTGLGHAAYQDLMQVLGGPCVPQVVGWCEVEVNGSVWPAIVVTQTWPFLPCGTDPAPIIKAKRWAALVPSSAGFRVVAVQAPPSDQRLLLGAAPDDSRPQSTTVTPHTETADTSLLSDDELSFLRASTTSGSVLLIRALDELAVRRSGPY